MIVYTAVISASCPRDHLLSGDPCMRKCGGPVRALQLFEVLQQQGLQPKVITFPAVTIADGRAVELFGRSRLLGLQPG